MQEVALILVRIETLEQFGTPVDIAAAHVVAGCNQVGTEHQGVIKKGFELDLAVAQDVRIRRASGLVFGKEVLEHVVPVLGGEVGGVQFDADVVAHGLSVGQVIHGGAIFGAVVLVPVLHKQAFDLIPLLKQEQGGNGGVDAAGHADDYALSSWI